jgi:hypothetical protein
VESYHVVLDSCSSIRPVSRCGGLLNPVGAFVVVRCCEGWMIPSVPSQPPLSNKKPTDRCKVAAKVTAGTTPEVIVMLWYRDDLGGCSGSGGERLVDATTEW